MAFRCSCTTVKVDRTTTGKGNLETQTFEELRKLKLVSKGEVTAETIPTLEEALRIAKGEYPGRSRP